MNLKKREFTKHIFYIFFVILPLVFAMPISAESQVVWKYPKGRILLYDGSIVEGKNLVLHTDMISLQIDGTKSNFKVSDIQQIMLKKGRPNFLAKNCGFGSLAAFIIFGLVIKDHLSPGDVDPAQYIISAIITPLSLAGLGYLIGSKFDDWIIIYDHPRISGTENQKEK